MLESSDAPAYGSRSPLISGGGDGAAAKCLPGPSFLGYKPPVLKQVAGPAPGAFPKVGPGSSLRIGISAKFPGDAPAAGLESTLPEPTRRSRDWSDFGSFKTPDDGSGFLAEISRVLNMETKIKY